MRLQLPILKLFWDDTERQLDLGPSAGEGRPVTYRLPKDFIAWIEEEGARLNLSASGVVRQLVMDLAGWFGLSSRGRGYLDQDRQKLQLDRRSYVQHVLLRRYEHLVRTGPEALPTREEHEAARARRRLEGKVETAAGTPVAIRLPKDFIAWIQEQAELYGMSAAGFVRSMIEDRTKWFGVPPTMSVYLEAEMSRLEHSFPEYMQLLFDLRADEVKKDGIGFERAKFGLPPEPAEKKDRK